MSIPSTIIDDIVTIGGITIAWQMIIAALVGVVTAITLSPDQNQNRSGYRAISQNLPAALYGRQCQPHVFGVILVIPPTICMIMIAPFWGIDPFMGMPLLMTAMLVSILGGLGNLKGSIVASYLIGFIHASVSFVFVPRFMGFAALIVTLIVMIYRRGGIFAGETLW